MSHWSVELCYVSPATITELPPKTPSSWQHTQRSSYVKGFFSCSSVLQSLEMKDVYLDPTVPSKLFLLSILPSLLYPLLSLFTPFSAPYLLLSSATLLLLSPLVPDHCLWFFPPLHLLVKTFSDNNTPLS